MTVGTPYYPGATQMPGPASNVYATENTVEGAIMHSAQGDWSDSYRPTDTMTQRGVSWHFSIFKNGRVEQHYSLNTSCWHAGSGTENRRLIGIEHEGGGPDNLSEPLAESQVVAGVALLRWIKEKAGWPDLARGARLLEHNEVYATACPSGRIPWARYAVLPQGEFLPEPEVSDAAAFYRAIRLGAQSDVDVTAVPASRPGWNAWRVEVKEKQ
jgi:N-acetyl-anhydromuramyl-L-alanine amidase AmpD